MYGTKCGQHKDKCCALTCLVVESLCASTAMYLKICANAFTKNCFVMPISPDCIYWINHLLKSHSRNVISLLLGTFPPQCHTKLVQPQFAICDCLLCVTLDLTHIVQLPLSLYDKLFFACSLMSRRFTRWNHPMRSTGWLAEFSWMKEYWSCCFICLYYFISW